MSDVLDHGDGYTEALWQLLTAARFMVQAARAADTGGSAEVHDALRAADGSAQDTIGYARDVRADHRAGPADANELGMEGPRSPKPAATCSSGPGYQVVRWASDGTGHSRWTADRPDLISAGETIAAAYDRYLRDAHVEDTIQIDADDPGAAR